MGLEHGQFMPGALSKDSGQMVISGHLWVWSAQATVAESAANTVLAGSVGSPKGATSEASRGRVNQTALGRGGQRPSARTRSSGEGATQALGTVTAFPGSLLGSALESESVK